MQSQRGRVVWWDPELSAQYASVRVSTSSWARGPFNVGFVSSPSGWVYFSFVVSNCVLGLGPLIKFLDGKKKKKN